MLVQMQQHVDFITLGVSDLAAARRFYVEGLGWEPTWDLDEVVFIQVAPGVLLALWPAADMDADIGAGPASGVAGQAPFSLAHNVQSAEEVDTAMARCVAAGGHVLKPAQAAAFGGYHGYVADPDGFRWEIAHNPGWWVEPDGRVHIGPVDG
jgi:catechol 2,3-dioxygenase-like lactoylglutathione lyase family enzyme